MLSSSSAGVPVAAPPLAKVVAPPPVVTAATTSMLAAIRAESPSAIPDFWNEPDKYFPPQLLRLMIGQREKPLEEAFVLRFL